MPRTLLRCSLNGPVGPASNIGSTPNRIQPSLTPPTARSAASSLWEGLKSRKLGESSAFKTSQSHMHRDHGSDEI